MQKDLTVSVSLKKVFRYLLAAAAVLAVLSLVVTLLKFSGFPVPWQIYTLFLLDGEVNLPTAFSVFLLLIAASALYLVSTGAEERLAKKWRVAAFVILLLAIDEWVSFHERLSAAMIELNISSNHPLLIFPWVAVAIAALLMLLPYFWPLLNLLNKNMKKLILLSAGVYLTGALGLEIVGGVVQEALGWQSLTYQLITTAEELLEILGLVMGVNALMLLLSESKKLIVNLSD